MDETVTPAPAPEETAPLTREEAVEMMNALEARLRGDQAAREQAISARQRELDEQALRALLMEEAARRGLPADLARTLSFPDEERMEQGLDALENAFRDAVRQAVEARIPGDAPTSQPAVSLDSLPDDQYYLAVCPQ